jgi:hypothetical protein
VRLMSARVAVVCSQTLSTVPYTPAWLAAKQPPGARPLNPYWSLLNVGNKPCQKLASGRPAESTVLMSKFPARPAVSGAYSHSVFLGSRRPNQRA